MRSVRFQLNYHVQGPNAPFLYASDSGLFADIGLDVEFVEGRSLTRATREVMRGAADLGFGDASHALELAMTSGSVDVCAIMPIYRRSPCSLGYVAREGTLVLEDLADARLAGPDGDTSARLLPALLARNGLAGLDYTLLTVLPAERDRMLVADEVLAVTCFDATLLFSMRANGYDTSALRFLRFADNGLDLYTGSLVCGHSLIEADPALPAKLRSAVCEALLVCQSDPQKGVSAVMRRRPETDPVISRDHLIWILENNVFPQNEPSTGSLMDSMIFDLHSERMVTTIAAATTAAELPSQGDGHTVVGETQVAGVLERVFPFSA